MSNYLKFLGTIVTFYEYLFDHLCKLHSLLVNELIIGIDVQILISVVRISAGLGGESELEGQLARVIYSRKSIRDSLPISDAVEGQKMRVVEPGDLLGIGLTEVIIEMGADELVTEECGNVHRAIIAHFVTRVPTIADRG